MKRLSLDKRNKLKYFLEQQENMTGIVMLLTIISYFVLFCITKNMFVLLFGYSFFYVFYTKIYKHIYFKIFGKE